MPLSFDGDPATVWSTLEYRGSPAFGNLKDGVGVLLDLGSEQELAGVTVTTHRARRHRRDPHRRRPPTARWTASPPPADGHARGQRPSSPSTSPSTARYVLVWITGLVEGDGGFSADLAEVGILAAG